MYVSGNVYKNQHLQFKGLFWKKYEKTALHNTINQKLEV